jgi:predicted patatin/cPLA2 family phospholipase
LDNTGLVLEGGGMRGVFTGGILECFMENDIHFPYIVGVSAGACNAASYVSRQPGRNRAITVESANRPDYISYKRLLRAGELFNMDLIFEQIPNKENPFDYYRFFQSNQKFYVGVTDCRTGEAVYYEKTDIKDELNKILRASSSLPLVAPEVSYKGRQLLDGGISDPIPVKQSIEAGNEKHIIILTQCKGYVKKPTKRGMWYFSRKYKQYQGLVNVIKDRSTVYNDTLATVNKLEEEGKAFIFRPLNLQNVSRIERRQDRLEALYNHGYELAAERLEELKHFLQP